MRPYLQARLVDEMHLTISPVLLGSGEHSFHGLDLRTLGYQAHLVVEEKRSSQLCPRGR